MIRAILPLLLLGTVPPQETTLIDFKAPLDRSRIAAWDAKVEPAKGGVRISTFHREAWPGATFKAPGGKWDLSRFTTVSLDVANVGGTAVRVNLRIDSGASDGKENCNYGNITLQPGTRGTIRAPLIRRRPVKAGFRFIGMKQSPTNPHGSIDPTRVTQVLVFVAQPYRDHVFEISNLRASGEYSGPLNDPIDPATYLPFIDAFGQDRHRTWPGKVKSLEDLRSRAGSERLDRRPDGWGRYGGWAKGPGLRATGFFRTEKHAGKWWLVDPEGRLFFSHGVNCVNFGGSTPVEERDAWFQNLPARTDPALGEFYHPAPQVVHGHFRWRKPLCFNFASANLRRKFGQDWKAHATDRIHRRLRSWGMNTIANWSDESIRLRRRTPYVVDIHYWSKRLAGSEGYWGQFPDVFDREFRAAIRARLAREKGKSAGDPWCIGYFVDNELSWGEDLTLASATLMSPREQRAKQVFIEDLRKKYGSIEKLNAAWKVAHASWEALLAHRGSVDADLARADLEAFSRKTAEQYFRVCRDEVKAIAANALYLGCRFAWVNDVAARAASKFCDVVSFNLYHRSIADFKMPGGADVPVLVGEFHFGALDRGPLASALVEAENQDERARLYGEYVTGALRHPQFVGAHWFQYRDQPTTGRELDGENFQVGLVDIADSPYPETVEAVRKAGYEMYATRLK